MKDSIRQIISYVTPLDSQEEAHVQYVLQWIDSGADLFRVEKPATPNIHLVSYFVVMSETMDQVLLIDHKRAKRWLPTGGHVELNEHPKDTVEREALEELNLTAEFFFDEPILLTVTPVEEHTDVSLWYLIKGDPEALLNYDQEEFLEARWFKTEDVPFSKADPHMKRFLQKVDYLVGVGCL